MNPESATEARPAQVLEYVVANVTRQGRRAANEDSCLAATVGAGEKQVAVVAVADGMGGLAGGDVASALAIRQLHKRVRAIAKHGGGSARDVLKAVFQRAHQAVLRHGRRAAQQRHLGTTLTAAVVRQGDVLIAHVGDTRAYLVREDDIRLLTHDHNVIQDLIDREVYTQEQLLGSPSLRVNALTRCIGHDDETLNADLVPAEPGTRLEVAPGTIVFLCSDGLTGLVDHAEGPSTPAVSDEEIRETLTTSTNLTEACRELVDRAFERGSSDNITAAAIAVWKEGEAPAAAAQPDVSGAVATATGASAFFGFAGGLRNAVSRAVAAVRRGAVPGSTQLLAALTLVAACTLTVLATQIEWTGLWSEQKNANGDAGRRTTPRLSNGRAAPVSRGGKLEIDEGSALTGNALLGFEPTPRVDPGVAATGQVHVTFLGIPVALASGAVRRDGRASNSFHIDVADILAAIRSDTTAAEPQRSGDVSIRCTLGGKAYSGKARVRIDEDLHDEIRKRLGK